MGNGLPVRTVAIVIGAVLLLTLAISGYRPEDTTTAEQGWERSGRAFAVRDAAMQGRVVPRHSRGAISLPSNDALSRAEASRHAGPPPDCKGNRRAELSRLYAMHARPADAEESIDAALLLLQLGRNSDAASLLGEASDRWPRDVELAWFAWTQCEPDTCDRDARLQRLLAVDPDNAVSWMGQVEDAWRRKDDKAVDAAIERAARAPDYATHEGVLFLHGMGLAREMSLSRECAAAIRRVIEEDMRHPATAKDIAIIEAENMENRVTPPAYSIAGACNPSAAPAASARRAACIALLPRLANAATQLERDVGTRGLLDLRSDIRPNDPLREAYRRQQWLIAQGGNLSYTPETFVRMHAEGSWKTLVDLASAKGLWPPPATWLPDAPSARSRVLGEAPAE